MDSWTVIWILNTVLQYHRWPYSLAQGAHLSLSRRRKTTYTRSLHHVKFIIPMALIQLEVLSDTVRVGFPAF